MRGPHERKGIPSHVISHRDHCNSFPILVGLAGPGIFREITSVPISTVIGSIIAKHIVIILIYHFLEMEAPTYPNSRFVPRQSLELLLPSL